MAAPFGRNIRASVGVIVVSIVIATTLLYFLSSRLDNHVQSIVSDLNSLDKRSADRASLAKLKKDALLAESLLPALSALLPYETQLIDLPGSLNDIASPYHLIFSFNFKEDQVAPAGDTPGQIGFVLTASGKSNDLFSFLKDVESSRRFLVVFNGVDVIRNADNYQASVQGVVYYKQDPGIVSSTGR